MNAEGLEELLEELAVDAFILGFEEGKRSASQIVEALKDHRTISKQRALEQLRERHDSI